LIAPLDLTIHLLKVCRREREFDATPDGPEFGFGVVGWFLLACFTQDTPNPLPNRDLLSPRETLNLQHLLVGQQNLQTLTHTMSIAYSLDELPDFRRETTFETTTRGEPTPFGDLGLLVCAYPFERSPMSTADPS
jgi:hypothetical protein